MQYAPTNPSPSSLWGEGWDGGQNDDGFIPREVYVGANL